MRRRPLVALACSLALTAAVGSAVAGAPASARPVFRSYESPVAKGHDGVPTTGLPNTNSYSQDGVGDDCGEPSLGFDSRTGAIMYQCVLQTLRGHRLRQEGPGELDLDRRDG